MKGVSAFYCIFLDLLKKRAVKNAENPGLLKQK